MFRLTQSNIAYMIWTKVKVFSTKYYHTSSDNSWHYNKFIDGCGLFLKLVVNNRNFKQCQKPYPLRLIQYLQSVRKNVICCGYFI